MAENFKFPDEQDDDKSVDLSAEDEIEIEVEDDTPLKDRGRRPLEEEVSDPSDEELEKYSSDVKNRIKKLTHSRHDERRAKEAALREREEAVRVAQQLLEQNKKLREQYAKGEQTFVDTAKSAAEAEVEMAKRQLKEAHESYDTDAIIAAQEALTEAKWKVQDLKNFRPTPLQGDKDEVQMRTYEPEAPKPDQKTLRWQARNQWFGAEGFEEITSFALGLHQKLVTSGVDPQSDEYYAQIDARVQRTFPELFGKEQEERTTQEVRTAPKRPSTVVASAGRTSGPKKVKLTETQLALAEKLRLTPQQYAIELAKLGD